MHWVVIPFRGAETSKSRLGDCLSDIARQHVARAMFQHVLNVACATARPERVLVVTPSATATRLARRAGASVLRDRTPGLNPALTQAAVHLRSRGASSATIVAADLPLLSRQSLASLMKWPREGCVGIARDRRGEGTNALALPLGLRFIFQFGDHSYFNHFRQIRKQLVIVRSSRAPDLAADLDLPSDLDLLGEPDALATLPAMGAGPYRGLR